jgi:DNA-binding response OmpR family regulator
MATILVADDEPDIRFLYEMWLTRRGFDVIVVTSGDATIEAITNLGVIDLVLLDVLMPGVNGLDVCRWIRSSERPGLPVVMLSALSRPADVAAGIEAGADVYLQKPTDPDEIVAVITALLEDARPSRHVRSAR